MNAGGIDEQTLVISSGYGRRWVKVGGADLGLKLSFKIRFFDTIECGPGDVTRHASTV